MTMKLVYFLLILFVDLIYSQIVLNSTALRIPNRKPDVCSRNMCVNKCCPWGMIFFNTAEYSYFCVKVPDNDTDLLQENRLEVYRDATDIDSKSMVNYNETFEVLIGITCMPGQRQWLEGDPRFFIQNDTRLFYEAPHAVPPWTILNSDKYCIDTFVRVDKQGNKSTQLDALVCLSSGEEETDTTAFIINSSCLLISCVFILATIAVYAWLPELRRNLHGRVLITYLCCLFCGFFFFAVMEILILTDKIDPNGCVALSLIFYFCMMSGFFWLNVMSFDIWQTFIGKRGTSLGKLSIRARFIAYVTYAFGVPTAMTIVLAGLEFSELKHPWLPNLKLQGCFFYGKSKVIYFCSPIAVLCVANCVFFILTAIRIARMKQQTAMLQSNESANPNQHRHDRQRLLLYVKLFIVMGINWLLEAMSGIFPQYTELWRITDVYNVLSGLMIFIIFVCKRKIFKLIKKRYKHLRGEPVSSQPTSSSGTSSSPNDILLQTTVKSNSET